MGSRTKQDQPVGTIERADKATPRAHVAACWEPLLLAPRQATLAYGIAADSLRALTEIKGVRYITFGTVLLVVWAAAGRTTLGWALVAAALTPVADALIVLTNRGKLSTALGIHGLTAALLIAAGLVLALRLADVGGLTRRRRSPRSSRPSVPAASWSAASGRSTVKVSCYRVGSCSRS